MVPKSERKRVTRAALWGAGILGSIGFISGSVICLGYSIPIPPVFITELGILVGGCLGALLALATPKAKPGVSPASSQQEWRTLS